MRIPLCRKAFRAQCRNAQVTTAQKMALFGVCGKARGQMMKELTLPCDNRVTGTGKETAMRTTALIATAMLATGIACASPANAGEGDWTGKMAIAGPGVANPDYTIPVEIHKVSEGHLRMSASNGCVEDWHIPAPGTASNTTNIQGGTYASGFMAVTVESGGGVGCTSAPQATVGASVQNGTHRTMTARTPDAAWEVYGDW